MALAAAQYVEPVFRDGVWFVSQATIRQTFFAFRVAWATYGTATLTALATPVLSFALYLLIIAYFLIPRGVDTDLADMPLQK